MEYLMTYGWAILVIAVVLGVLFQLGAFSTANFAPKAKSGQCQVQVVGSGSSSTHQLAGLCSAELPQFVGQFNGNQYVGISPVSAQIGSFTVTAWVLTTAPTNGAWGTIFETNQFDFERYGNAFAPPPSNGFVLRWIGGASASTPTPLPQNTWAFVAVTKQNNVASLYYNGQLMSTQGANAIPQTVNSIRIGEAGLSGIGGLDQWSGSISNVQFYNAALSQAEITALYDEGIGGAPVRPQNVTGWWPLNGDTNDYGGNNYNGQNNGVGYSSYWTNGYSAP